MQWPVKDTDECWSIWGFKCLEVTQGKRIELPKLWDRKWEARAENSYYQLSASSLPVSCFCFLEAEVLGKEKVTSCKFYKHQKPSTGLCALHV